MAEYHAAFKKMQAVFCVLLWIKLQDTVNLKATTHKGSGYLQDATTWAEESIKIADMGWRWCGHYECSPCNQEDLDLGPSNNKLNTACGTAAML